MRHQARNSEFHLTPAELARLLAAAMSRRDRLVVSLFAFTGIRRAELRLLERGDLDFERNRLLIRNGKGRKQRIVFIPESLARELEAYCRKLEGRFLFPGATGGPMSLRNVNYILQRVGEAAGLRTPNPRYWHIGPHLLRHSFARNWKRAGGSLESLQKILGHSSLKTTLDAYGTESQPETEANYRAVASRLVHPVAHS